jgi:hypothetical protein
MTGSDNFGIQLGIQNSLCVLIALRVLLKYVRHSIIENVGSREVFLFRMFLT